MFGKNYTSKRPMFFNKPNIIRVSDVHINKLRESMSNPNRIIIFNKGRLEKNNMYCYYSNTQYMVTELNVNINELKYSKSLNGYKVPSKNIKILDYEF